MINASRMSERLPLFRYHPDPVGTGSIVQSDEVCERCGERRGFVYAGPIYTAAKVELLCPWCIADGSAAQQFDADFTATDGAPDDVPPTVLDEVVHRNPGFTGWQQEQWMFHCTDAAEFRGVVGWDEVRAAPGAVDALLADGWREEDLPSMSVDGDLVGYLFRCRHCGANLANADAS